MNYWRNLKIIGYVLLVIVLGGLALLTDGQSQQPSTNVSAPSSSSDGAAFNGIK